MARRKPGSLLPLEVSILETGVEFGRNGEAEFHGFLVAKALRDRDGARALTGHGTLYKALDRMERAGLLESRWEDPAIAASDGRPRRRLYRVTGAGAHTLTSRQAPIPQRDALDTAARDGVGVSAPVTDRLTRRWVHAYTRSLPAGLREERRAEVNSDLWEHRSDTRERGLGPALTALEVVGRLLAGMPADLAWRHTYRQSTLGTRRATRIERNPMAATTTPAKLGYPLWLTILAAVTGGFATLMGIASTIAHTIGSENDTAIWSLLLFTVGASILLALWLVSRVPLVSIVLLALGGIGFGLVTYWMMVTIAIGIAIAIGAALSAPRVLRSPTAA